MNCKTTLITSLFFCTLSSTASADYVLPQTRIGDALGNLWAQEACGTLNLVRGGFVSGLEALTARSQQTLPISDAQIPAMCEQFPNAVHLKIAQRPLVISRNNGDAGSACDQQLVSDIVDYNSGAPAWAKALQLVYGGKNGEGSEEACSDPQRRELIENWGKIWANACDGGDCEKLRFAFRPGDENPTSLVFRQLVGISAFCNGNHFQDNDPLRSDCNLAFDVDFCDPRKGSSLGVVQAVHLADFYDSFNGGEPTQQPNRRQCTFGNWAFALSSELNDELFDGTCPDDSEPFAGFLCLYPRDCNNHFGCVNTLDNTSVLNPFMDGRAYNLLRSYNRSEPHAPVDLVDDSGAPIAQLTTLNLNGECATEVDELGENTSRQIGCLVSRIKCSMGLASNAQLSFRTVQKDAQVGCGEIMAERESNRAVAISTTLPDDAGYPLIESFHFSADGVPPNASNNALDCDAILDPEEQKACRCVFDQSITLDAMGLGAKLAEQGLDLVPGGPKASRCVQ